MKRRLSLWMIFGASALASSLIQAQTFKNLDIGSPALAGATMVDQRKVTVTGAGVDIWGASDQCQFYFTRMTGDFDAKVRVESLQGSHQWAKAELMVRVAADDFSDPQGGDPFYAMMTTRSDGNGQNDVGPQWRAARAASAAWPGAALADPTYPNTWLRVVKTGSQLTGYSSDDGINWLEHPAVDTAAEPGWEVFPATVYVGLAVTSHDGANSSATAIFHDLSFSPGGAPVMAQQPQNQTVPEGGSASFTATASGAPGNYQWTRDGAELEGATNWTYTLSKVRLSDSGAQFAVKITNPQGSVMSRPASLTVQPDTTPPQLLRARGSGNPQGIIVTFSEDMDAASATNVNNYQITGQNLTISSAAMLSSAQVLLWVSEFTPDPMTLTVNAVKDASAGGNAIPANSKAAILAASTLAAYWSFDEGSGPITAEKTAGYNGTFQGAPAWSTATPPLGRPNPACLEFNGLDSYLTTTYPGVAGPQARTVSFWVNSADTATAAMVGWGDSTRNQTKYHVRIEPSTGSLRTEVQGGNLWGTAIINDGQWHHVVSVVPDLPNPNNSNVLHYVDGVLDPALGGGAQPVNTDVAAANSLPVWVGARNQAGAMQYFTGLIDELAIFQTALTDAQISSLSKGADPTRLAAPLGAPLSINQQPSNVRAGELDSATFEVNASGSSILGFQWFRDGQPISGANGRSFSIPAVNVQDNGAKFHVEVFNADGTYKRLVSETATLTVDSDRTPPQVVFIRGSGAGLNKVFMRFDEPVDAASATALTNYLIQDVAILSAVLETNGTKVTLTTSGLTNGTPYSLQISRVKDLSTRGNELNRTIEFSTYSTYPDVVALDAPDLYFPFAESTGGQVRDAAAKDPNYVGTLTSTATGVPPRLEADRIVPGAPDKAVGFTAGNSGWIAFNTDSALVNTGGPYEDKTIEFWFKANTLPAFLSTAAAPDKMCLYEQGGTTRGIAIYLCGTEDSTTPKEAALYFHAWNDNADGAGSPWGGPESEGKVPVIVKTTVKSGETYHAVMVMDGDNSDLLEGKIEAYLNGRKLPTPGMENLVVGLLYNHGDNAGLGGVNQNCAYHDDNRGVANGDYFDGVIDEFAYYNKALSPDRIQAHYNQGLVEVPFENEPPSQPLIISRISVQNGQVTLEWQGGGELQSAELITGPFTAVPAASSPHTAPVEAAKNRFYRVVRP